MRIFSIHDFIKSDSDFFKILKFLPKIEESGPWVAGGSLWKSIENIPLDSDIDLFFRDEIQCGEWLKAMRTVPYEARVISEKINSYNISMNYHVNHGDFNKTIKIQCIYFKYFTDIVDLLNSFDFTACQFGFDGTNLHAGETSFEDLKNRHIIFNNVADNVASGLHMRKYVEKGFTVPDSQLEKLKEIVDALTAREKKNEERWSLSSSSSSDEDMAYPQPRIPQAIGDLDLTPIFPSTIPHPEPQPASVEFYSAPEPALNNYVSFGTISNAYANTTNTYVEERPLSDESFIEAGLDITRNVTNII